MSQLLGRDSMTGNIAVVAVCAVVLAAAVLGLSVSSQQMLPRPTDDDHPSALLPQQSIDAAQTTGSELPGIRSVSETTTVDSPISDSERQGIMQWLTKFGLTTEIGEIERLSVDSFSVELRDELKGAAQISLRDDNILTEGDLTLSEIESIKSIALRRRTLLQYGILIIQQTSPNTVHVMTGGSVGGESMLLERSGTVWEVKSIGQWVE